MKSAHFESVNRETEGLLLDAAKATGDHRISLQNKVVELNLGLATALASRYVGRGPDRDDLIQVASIGLVKAVRRFDPGKGNFYGFAVPTIRGELKRHFRDQCWAVRPPRRIQDLQASLSAASEKRLHKYGRQPKPEELAEDLASDVIKVREALSAGSCYNPTSLDARRDADGRSIGESLPQVDTRFELVEDLATFSPLCRGLSDSDRELLSLRFFQDKTQQEIATEMGTSQMQVSRRLKRILEELRRSTLPSSVA
ncbi:MAG: sigma-70 family RNA polymerase sigma factor [Actinomycetota bacterium]|nr:sigma-70 family RNA polymerase sigma factor [Actinomycetota bacterium]